MRSVVLRTGALGDFVATIPVLSRLREEGPVTVVADGRYRPLFAADRWIDANGAEGAAIFGGSPLDADLGLAWTATAADALEACGVRRVLRGSPRPPPGMSIHDHLWSPLVRSFGARDRDPAVPEDPEVGVRISARLDRRPVVLAPGSGGQDKRWPIERWQAIAQEVPALWVGGPIEAAEPGWGSPRWDDLDLRGIVALARRCRAWLGPDAGPGHLARAAGARVGVVFVSTDPANWAPPGARVFGAADHASALVDFALADP